MANLLKKLRKEKEWYERNNCTYHGDRNDTKAAYIMGFTVQIKQGVCASRLGEGGWLCDIHHANDRRKVFSCYITSSAFGSVTKFRSEISKTHGMPAVIITSLDSKLLSSFVVWKQAEWISRCAKNGVTPDKLSIEHRNMQSDKVSYCFGPEIFFERKEGNVCKVPSVSSAYVWVQANLESLMPLELYSGNDQTNVLEVIRAKLADDNMPETFICFLLVCGHTTILNLHYKEMLDLFMHVPALIATGPRNTGKTLSTDTSVSFLGTNAAKICIAKDMTLSALRDRYTADHFPLVIHDQTDYNTIATAVHECYEGRDVKKHEQQLVPGTTIALTCNEAPMAFLQSRFEALSRTVIIPMLTELHPMTEDQFNDIHKGQECASRHFTSLLNVTDDEKRRLHRRTFGLRSAVTGALSNVTDSHHRIAENYSMLIAATELFLEKTGSREWTAKVEPYVLRELLPRAAPYYTFRTQAGGSLASPVVEDTAHSSGLIAKFCATIRRLKITHADDVTLSVKVLPVLEFVAVREDRFRELLTEVDHEDNIDFGELLMLRGVKMSLQVRFQQSSSAKRSVGIPKIYFKKEQLRMLEDKNLVEVSDEEVNPTPVHTTVSPFKQLSAAKIVDDESVSEFHPEATSTQNQSRHAGTGNVNEETVGEELLSRQRISPIKETTPQRSPEIQSQSLPAALEQPWGTFILFDQPGSSNMTQPKRLQNASFSRTSAVAINASMTDETREDKGKKMVRRNKIICAACEKASDDYGNEDTFLCSTCKDRFHLGCQPTDPRVWPERTNARGRKCTKCRI